MAEDGGIETVASGDVLAEIPNIKPDGVAEQNGEQDKPTLNRSASCGSILQGNGINKMKNLSRRVSFPSDDKLISGYNEPKNPWEHAHETTTEDLIQAYTQACQQWNVRPITKLLLQLQEIADFTVRANSLTLKGEKLEMRVVETLESIFKRVQFITIDLEATNLDEDAGASLFDMIEYYESAVNVLVGFNKNLGNRGWQAAAHMMRKMSCLRLFDGHSVPLSIQASPFVGRALRLSNTLVTLHLENATLSGRPLLLIVAALRMNTTLRELFLADNRFSPLDALQIANLLKFNRILQLLDIRNNPIQDMGLGHLCAGLMAQSGTSGLNGPIGGLNTLVLWNNQISHEGMAKLAMALRYTVSLSTLNLGQNVLGDDGILRLKEGLLQNHSLLRLGLVGTKLTDEGAVAIAEYLAESPRIIRLDLRNNDIRVAGLMALSLAFKINNSLLRLDIDKPNKKDSLKELAAKQESLLNDMVSYAARNKQAALQKAQAAQQRQEEARRAEANQESGLRYMDMTNASTSPSTSSLSATEQASSNNSNNQSPELRIKGQEFKGTDGQSSSPSVITVTPDTDDTPEDSPEFLPRSSVSYHQVAPVMLSNSEIAKRAAAAAKLQPVVELHEENMTPIQRLGAISKLVNDVSHGANGTITSVNERPNESKAPLEVIENQSRLDAPEDKQPDVSQSVPAGGKEPESVNVSDKELSELTNRSTNDLDIPNTDASEEHNFSTVTQFPPNSDQSSSETDAEKPGLTDESALADHDAVIHVFGQEVKVQGQAEQHSSSEVKLGEDEENNAHQSEISGEVDHGRRDAVKSATSENVKNSHVEMTTANAVVLDSHQVHDSSSKNRSSHESLSSKTELQMDQDGDEAAIRALVSMATDLKAEHVSDPSVQSEGVTESDQKEPVEDESAIKALVALATESTSEGQHHPVQIEEVSSSLNCEKDCKDLSIEQPTVVVTTKVDDDVTTEESSGFENAAEENSIQSGDLSPMEDDKWGYKLLTPDSGIVQFDNAGPNKENMGPEDAREMSGNEETTKDDANKPDRPPNNMDSPVQNCDTSAINSEYQSPESLNNGPETASSKTVNMALDLSQNTTFEDQTLEHGDFQTQTTAQIDGNCPKTAENLMSEGAINSSVSKNIPKVLDSPCEVEVSHFDLNKFPSGD